MYFVNEVFPQSTKQTFKNVISGFRRDVNEVRALLGYYAAESYNSISTFQDNLSYLQG